MGKYSSYVSLGTIPSTSSGTHVLLTALLIGFVIGIIATFLFLQNTPYLMDLQTSPVWLNSFRKYGDPHGPTDFDEILEQHSPLEDFHKDEDVLAKKLARKVRVLCWVLTSPVNHDAKAKHVKATWGKRCNTLIFMSSVNDSFLGAVDLNVKESHDLLWGKTKRAFSHVYKYHQDEYDWVLKADDDTYVVVENLRFMLYTYNSSEPMYFGCRFKPFVKQGYMSGGAGYVLSKEAVRRFVTLAIPNSSICSPQDTGAEDVEIGQCLENVGVEAMDSRDQYQRGRFFPFVPEDHLFNKYDPSYWYWDYIFYNTTDGMNCCSDLAVTFHYISARQMYVMDYLIYHLRPYGIQHQDKLHLPDNSHPPEGPA